MALALSLTAALLLMTAAATSAKDNPEPSSSKGLIAQEEPAAEADESVETVEPADAVEPVETAESDAAVETTEPANAIEPAVATEPVDTTEPSVTDEAQEPGEDAGIEEQLDTETPEEAVCMGEFVVTAYALPGTMASGLPVQPGAVATDPRVIPLGTKLTIEGIDGEFTALDTGGGVLGSWIDIWMPSYWDAINWGNQARGVCLVP